MVTLLFQLIKRPSAWTDGSVIRVMRMLLGAWLASAGTVAAGQQASVEPWAPGQKVTQKIEGTMLSFELMSIPGGVLKKEDPLNPNVALEVPIRGFWMSTTEATWDLYDVFAFGLDQPEAEAQGADASTRPSKPYLPADRGFGHAGYPAISITFHGAKEFCRWLSEKTGRPYRLATRDEWEWACSAGGSVVSATDDTAWHKGNSEEKTQPVAKKSPNPWGLYDMFGNVGEWTVAPDGKGRMCGGTYQMPLEELVPSLTLKQVPDWNKRDPQMPKSRWWLSDGPFAGFRIVCDAFPIESAPASEGAPK